MEKLSKKITSAILTLDDICCGVLTYSGQDVDGNEIKVNCSEDFTEDYTFSLKEPVSSLLYSDYVELWVNKEKLIHYNGNN